SLFAAIARDLERKGACVRKGTLIDATIIASASKGDGEAAWAKHKSRGPSHGYKAHIAADKDTGIIRKVETTPANEADVAIGPEIIPDEPGEVYGDKAYDALSVEAAIEASGGVAKLLRKGHRWLKAKTLEAHNRPLKPIRARIEKIFGTWKRSYHFRAMGWTGLGKAKLQVHLGAFAFDNTPVPKVALKDLTIEAIEVETTTAMFDLAVDIVDSADGLSISFEYNTDLFFRSTIER